MNIEHIEAYGSQTEAISNHWISIISKFNKFNGDTCLHTQTHKNTFKY